MDIEGSVKSLVRKAENHATLLTFLGTSIARSSEANPDLGGAIGDWASYLTFQQGWNPLSELQQDVSSLGALTWKLYRSPHVPTTVFKFSAGIWAFGKLFDFIPEKYVTLAGNIAKGALAAALVMPGSGPGDSKSGMNQQTGKYTSSPLNGSTLNSAPGAQPTQGYQSVYPGNPTSGSLYTVASGQRPIGN